MQQKSQLSSSDPFAELFAAQPNQPPKSQPPHQQSPPPTAIKKDDPFDFGF